MADYFFDSSALVKRYLAERGSTWVNGIVATATAGSLWLASLTGVEIVSAITRRSRSGIISASDVTLLVGQFRREWSVDYVVVDLEPSIIDEAIDLAEKHGLRGADSLQLAAALEVGRQCASARLPLILVSADTELNAAATAEGLSVDDPNLHP